MFGALACQTEAGTYGPVPTINCLPALFARIITVLIIFAGAVALILFLWGSLKFIFSGGDPKAVASAKNTMTYALIGLAVVLLSFAILNFIAGFLGLPAGSLLQFGFGQ